ncbi:hypothetical protein PN499_08325, partial [Kamptonema animale CS-326]|nr:hypothetical protein [Kamptonema animale CS-326]
MHGFGREGWSGNTPLDSTSRLYLYLGFRGRQAPPNHCREDVFGVKPAQKNGSLLRIESKREEPAPSCDKKERS